MKKTLLISLLCLYVINVFAQTPNFNQFSDKHIAITDPANFNMCTLTVPAGKTLQIIITFGGQYESLVFVYNQNGTEVALINNQSHIRDHGLNGNVFSYTNSSSQDVTYKLVFQNKSGWVGQYKHEQNPWMKEPIKVTVPQNPYVIGARENGLNAYQSTIAQVTFK